MALYSADPERSAVVRQLAGALTLLGADRAAAIWVDEYGPGLVHVHALLDVASDEPCRSFSLAPLKAAWEEGIPGLLDRPDCERGLSLYSCRPRSQAVVSLGSDGNRAWFVVVDSRTARSELGPETAELLMFFAGECAGVLLHRDLPETADDRRRAEERLRQERFAGWPVLRDIEGREGDDRANRRVSCRFMVSRMIRRLIEDDFALDAEALSQQVEGVRRELNAGPAPGAGGKEPELWERVLDSAAELDLLELASATLQLANEVENQGHLYGARELHRCAYDVAVAASSGKMVVDALRFHGRTCRKLGEMEAADYWYERADEVARELGEPGLVARVLTGRANLKRQLGNFPEARKILTAQEDVAEASGDGNLLAQCHHGWMALEKDAENWEEAVVRGWKAFGRYSGETDRFIALADLGWTFLESGSMRSAEDAFSVLLAQVELPHLQAIAREGMVRLAALRGDRRTFSEWLQRADLAWKHLQPATRAEARLFRASSFEALGEMEKARACLEAARAEAEESGINRILIEAEAMLDELPVASESRPEHTKREEWEPLENSGDDRVVEVLQGLSNLRAAAEAV